MFGTIQQMPCAFEKSVFKYNIFNHAEYPFLVLKEGQMYRAIQDSQPVGHAKVKSSIYGLLQVAISSATG